MWARSCPQISSPTKMTLQAQFPPSLQIVLNLQWFTYDFLTLQLCESNTKSAETILQILGVDLFPGCLMMLGSDSKPQVRSATQSWGWTTNTSQHSAATQPFCFPLLVQYSLYYIRYSKPHYKIGSVLDDFAQLQADVSVLGTSEVG